jgi:hypothetical protein
MNTSAAYLTYQNARHNVQRQTSHMSPLFYMWWPLVQNWIFIRVIVWFSERPVVRNLAKVLKLGHVSENGTIDIPTVLTGVSALSVDILEILLINKLFTKIDNTDIGISFAPKIGKCGSFFAKLAVRSIVTNTKNIAHNSYAIYKFYRNIHKHFMNEIESIDSKATLSEKRAIMSDVNIRVNALSLQLQNCAKEVSKFALSVINLLFRGDYSIMLYDIAMVLPELFISTKMQYWFDIGKKHSIEQNKIHESLNNTNTKHITSAASNLTDLMFEADYYMKNWGYLLSTIDGINSFLFADREYLAAFSIYRGKEFDYNDANGHAEFFKQATDIITFYARNSLRFIEIYTAVLILLGVIDRIEEIKLRPAKPIEEIKPQPAKPIEETRNDQDTLLCAKLKLPLKLCKQRDQAFQKALLDLFIDSIKHISPEAQVNEYELGKILGLNLENTTELDITIYKPEHNTLSSRYFQDLVTSDNVCSVVGSIREAGEDSVQ